MRTPAILPCDTLDNGARVIAARPVGVPQSDGAQCFVVMAHTTHGAPFVTWSVVKRMNGATESFWGRYFESLSGAAKDYEKRRH